MQCLIHHVCILNSACLISRITIAIRASDALIYCDEVWVMLHCKVQSLSVRSTYECVCVFAASEELLLALRGQAICM